MLVLALTFIDVEDFLQRFSKLGFDRGDEVTMQMRMCVREDDRTKERPPTQDLKTNPAQKHLLCKKWDRVVRERLSAQPRFNVQRSLLINRPPWEDHQLVWMEQAVWDEDFAGTMAGPQRGGEKQKEE